MMISGAARNAAAALFAASMSVAAIFAICVPVAGAASPKPDLVVRAFQFKSTPPNALASVKHAVIEQDHHGTFSLVYKIKNVGNARAHRSTVRIVVNGQKIGEVQIGAIAPGGAITVRRAYNPRFRGPGRFKVFACADFGDPSHRVRESNERNNYSRDVFFRAIPRRWNVETFTTGPSSLVGSAPFFASRSVGMTFDFYGIVNDEGLYFLWLAKGGLAGSVSGSEGACTYSGEGSVSHSPWDVIPPEVGFLEISPQLDSYFAEVKDDGYIFTATQTCTGWPPNDSNHNIWTLETIGLDGRVDRPMSESDTTLAGNYTIPTGFGGSGVGAWSFKADL